MARDTMLHQKPACGATIASRKQPTTWFESRSVKFQENILSVAPMVKRVVHMKSDPQKSNGLRPNLSMVSRLEHITTRCMM